jgi:hypothetical protein
MTTRIWLQSKTDLAKLPGYVSILTDHAKTICGPDTVVDLHGVAPGTFPAGTSPNEAARYNWLGELTTQQIVENVMRAEREGYDAFAIFRSSVRSRARSRSPPSPARRSACCRSTPQGCAVRTNAYALSVSSIRWRP